MSLVTRCPACGTAFRVQSEQLAVRGGQVRCGRCNELFDGVARLVDKGTPEAGAARAAQPATARESGKREAAPAAATRETRVAATKPTADEPLPPFLVDEAPRPALVVLWSLLALLAAFALAAQALLHFRTEAVSSFPWIRPYLAAACEELGCRVRLPHRPDLMSIESSDLRADPQRASLIQFNAVLRNRAQFAQEYPSLELTLTDEKDAPVARRVLEPAEYLDVPRAAELVELGLAPGAEAVMRLTFDAGRMRAIGYRLYLFYH